MPRFGTPELLFMLSVGVLIVVVAFPMLLIFFNAFWVDGHFNVADVVRALQTYLGSSYVNDFNLLGRTFRVTAQAEADYRVRADSILKLRVRNSRGDPVPLGSFTTVKDVSGPYRVPRHNLYPAAELDAAAARDHPRPAGRDALARTRHIQGR